MPKGISIHIGINAASADCCSKELLKGAENDARAMADIAATQQFRVLLRQGGDATRSWLEEVLADAARELEEGDILLLTYSGHGCRVVGNERDFRDETWCLADEQMRDNHLNKALARFSAGVRIVVVSDSCHSGSILARASEGRLRPAGAPPFEDEETGAAESVAGRREAQAPTSLNDLRVVRRGNKFEIQANVLLLFACRADETARDADPTGLFTAALLKTWAQGNFRGSYRDLILAIHSLVSSQNPKQNPGWTCDGTCDEALLDERAFTI